MLTTLVSAISILKRPETCTSLKKNASPLKKMVNEYYNYIKPKLNERYSFSNFPSPGDNKDTLYYYLGNTTANSQSLYNPWYPSFREDLSSRDIIESTVSDLNKAFQTHNIPRKIVETSEFNSADLVWGRVDTSDKLKNSEAFLHYAYFDIRTSTDDLFIGFNTVPKFIIASVGDHELTSHDIFHELAHFPFRINHPQDFNEFKEWKEASNCYLSKEELVVNLIQESLCQTSHLIYENYCFYYSDQLSHTRAIGNEDLNYWNISTSLNPENATQKAEDELFEYALNVLDKKAEELPGNVKLNSLFYFLYGLVVPILGEVLKHTMYRWMPDKSSSVSVPSLIREGLPFAVQGGVIVGLTLGGSGTTKGELSPVDVAILELITFLLKSDLLGNAIKKSVGNFPLLYTLYLTTSYDDPSFLLLIPAIVMSELIVKSAFRYTEKNINTNPELIDREKSMLSTNTRLITIDNTIANSITPSYWLETAVTHWQKFQAINKFPDVSEPRYSNVRSVCKTDKVKTKTTVNIDSAVKVYDIELDFCPQPCSPLAEKERIRIMK